MVNKSVNEAKKFIWSDLQALCGDIDYWEPSIEDWDWDRATFKKALNSIYNQLEKKT